MKRIPYSDGEPIYPIGTRVKIGISQHGAPDHYNNSYGKIVGFYKGAYGVLADKARGAGDDWSYSRDEIISLSDLHAVLGY